MEFNLFRRDYWFGQVDARPASLFRIVFCAWLLKDAHYHVFIADLFYSDAGFTPRAAISQVQNIAWINLMQAVGEGWLAQIVFGLWMVVLLALLMGYRTRLMSILNWVLIISIHWRNFSILNGADGVMRVLSFWMIFLPVASYYSVDGIKRRWKRYRYSGNLADLRVEDQPRTGFALPLRLIQLQIALIYLFTFVQ